MGDNAGRAATTPPAARFQSQVHTPVEIHSPDPAFTRSALARANFRLAFRLAAGFVAFLCLIALMGWGLELERFGVRPREWVGLPGILVAPLLHAGFEHLIANSPPLLVLGTAMLYLYPTAARRVLPAVSFGPGLLVWLFGEGGTHVGASGLVYGLVSYIFVAGLMRRDRRAVAASLLVAFMYGALTWGMFPIRRGMSWETHLAAALIGLAMAFVYRQVDVPPRKRYEWEGRDADGEPGGADGDASVDALDADAAAISGGDGPRAPEAPAPTPATGPER